VQTGGQTISQRTADALNLHAGSNLSRRDVGRALEALKREKGLPNRLQGSRILDNGDLLDDSGKVLGNITHYFP
jgi:filamentous hemagglutinin